MVPTGGPFWISTQEVFSYLSPRVSAFFEELLLGDSQPRQTPVLYDPIGRKADFLLAPPAAPPTVGGLATTNYKAGNSPFAVTTYKAGTGGWNVTTYKANFGIGPTLANAELVVSDPTKQSWTSTCVDPNVNYDNNGSAGRFGGSIQPPGLTGATNDFVVVASGTIYIPTSGPWTFGTQSDDGFKLTIDGALFNNTVNATIVGGSSIQVDGGRGMTDSFGIINYLPAGFYNVRYLCMQGGGGAGAELFAAPGMWSGWDGNVFQLVGNETAGPAVVGQMVAGPSTPNGWNATVYKVNGGFGTNIADAENVVVTPSRQSWIATETAPYINYNQTGTGGNYGNDRTVPGMTIDSDVDNYVVVATTTVYIPTTGPYTFWSTATTASGSPSPGPRSTAGPISVASRATRSGPTAAWAATTAWRSSTTCPPATTTPGSCGTRAGAARAARWSPGLPPAPASAAPGCGCSA